MNIQELETVRRERLPIKILVVNNKELGKISEIQHNSYHDRFCITNEESGYTVPDFEKVAVAYGIKAATLSSYEKLDGYKEWLYDNEPCLLNIMLTPLTLLIPKVQWETGVIEPKLRPDIARQIKQVLNDEEKT